LKFTFKIFSLFATLTSLDLSNIIYVAGSAGPRRFKLPRCIAFLVIHSTGDIEVDFTPVDTRLQEHSVRDIDYNRIGLDLV
jgi:hypothetical protein